MSKKILLAALALILSSCGDDPRNYRSGGGGSGGSGGGGQPPGDVELNVLRSESQEDAASLTGSWKQTHLFCYDLKTHRPTSQLDISGEGHHYLRAYDPTFPDDAINQAPYIEFQTRVAEGRPRNRRQLQENLIYHSVFDFPETRPTAQGRDIDALRVVHHYRPHAQATYMSSVYVEKTARQIEGKAKNEKSFFAAAEGSSTSLDLNFYIEFQGQERSLHLITTDFFSGHSDLCPGTQHMLHVYEEHATPEL